MNNLQELIYHKTKPKQTNLTHSKIRLPKNYWLINQMYRHLTVCKQMSSDSFKNVIYKLWVYKSYILKEDLHFLFLSRVIILWIELPEPENPCIAHKDSWFSITCVRYWLMAQLESFGSAICGRWLDLQWWRYRYTLLMRPNKVETDIQCFRMSCVGVRRIFWSW